MLSARRINLVPHWIVREQRPQGPTHEYDNIRRVLVRLRPKKNRGPSPNLRLDFAKTRKVRRMTSLVLARIFFVASNEPMLELPSNMFQRNRIRGDRGPDPLSLDRSAPARTD